MIGVIPCIVDPGQEEVASVDMTKVQCVKKLKIERIISLEIHSTRHKTQQKTSRREAEAFSETNRSTASLQVFPERQHGGACAGCILLLDTA